LPHREVSGTWASNSKMIDTNQALVVFSHGKDSSPKATKIMALQPIAEARGWQTLALDYQGENDPAKRLEKLLTELAAHQGRLVLVGSSLGGLISVFGSQKLKLEGLFLLAPAVYWPGYEHLDYSCRANLIEIVHGWHDDVVPVDLSIRLAREQSATLHLLDDDHRLHARLGEIECLFDQFLSRLA
jgi:predicted esterase